MILHFLEQIAAVAIALLFVFEILLPLIAGDPLFPTFRREKHLNDLEDSIDRSARQSHRIKHIRKKASNLSSTIQKETSCPPSPGKPNSKPNESDSSPDPSSSDS